MPIPTIPNTAVTRSRNVRVPSKCMPNSWSRPAGRLCGPERERLEEEHELHQRRERQRREREIETLEPQRREREQRADRHDHERRDDHRVAVAVRAAEARVRDRADAGEREPGERHLPGPADERHERHRDERGAHREREAVEVRRRQERG